MSGSDNTSMTVRTVAGTTTALQSDYVVLVLAAGANNVFTIPAASTFGPAGRTLRIYKDAAAFTTTITPTGGLIDGAATKVLAASAAHAALIVSDGTNWYSVSSY